MQETSHQRHRAWHVAACVTAAKVDARIGPALLTSRSWRRVPKPAGDSIRRDSFRTASTYGNCVQCSCRHHPR